MSERLPYELALNQQWLDLPLPDENMAWADMRRRLDEDENKRVIPWWRSCAGIALLAVLLLGTAWLILRPEKWFRRNTTAVQTSTDTKTKGNSDSVGFHDSIANTTVSGSGDSDLSAREDQRLTAGVNATNNTSPVIDSKGKEKEPVSFSTGKGTVGKKKSRSNADQPIDAIKKKDDDKDSAQSKQEIAAVKTNEPKIEEFKIDPKKEATITIITTIPEADSARNPTSMTEPKKDSLQKKDTLVKSDQLTKTDKGPKKDSSKKNPMVFSAGLGLNQLIPVSGQKWSPYNSSGRKASLADYIPSVYLRATKPGKWFLQAEFRYGAPQHNKQIPFRQIPKLDTIQGTVFQTTTTYKLQKTYYHHLPLSFNYYILPNWSVGAGVQWNSFYSAIAESEVVFRNPFTQQDSVLSKTVQSLKKDSAAEFNSTYWQGIIQTQYQWKRFSFGARYNVGITPFINYTLPGQAPREEKNHSFQVYLLFELWRSKRSKN